MEEIKGMSDQEARRWLQKHGYGLGDIEMILAGENPTADDVAPEAPVPAPKPEPVKAAPAPKAEPVKAAPAPKPKTIPQPAAKAAPKASK